VIEHVASLADPRLDDYRNVPDPELLRSRGLFVAEGRLVVRRLLDASPYRTRSVLLTPAAHERLADLVDRHPDVPVYVVAPDAMNAIAGFNIHRGCLAVGERPAPRPHRELLGAGSPVVVLEGVSNADNVGGIFRSAAAFGAAAVLLGPGCADPLYRKAIRTSMGAALTVPFAAMPNWPDDLREVRAAGFTLVALTPAADAVPLHMMPHGVRLALIAGHEGEGLTSAALAAADVRARISIAAGVDSLNVAAAATIALYEAWCRGSRSARSAPGTADRVDTDPTWSRPEGR
jgi:tRNA G18 (ribose-2'-O)-methylase SpoU